eukprot:scaffold2398_cov340-Pinguiococcus_pyrenoidosus.AAC.1
MESRGWRRCAERCSSLGLENIMRKFPLSLSLSVLREKSKRRRRPSNHTGTQETQRNHLAKNNA